MLATETLASDDVVIGGLSLAKLNSTLNTVDQKAINSRKTLLNRLYHEALLTEEAGKGVSFTNMLLLLAQYKLIEPEKALR